MTFIKEQNSADQITIENVDSCECSCANIRVDCTNDSGASACGDAGISSSSLPSVISA